MRDCCGCEEACSANTKLVYGQRHECLGFSWEDPLVASSLGVCKYFFLYKVPLAAGNCTPANAFLDLEDCFTPSALPGTFLRVGAPGGALLNTLAAPPEVCYNTVGGFTCGVNDAPQTSATSWLAVCTHVIDRAEEGMLLVDMRVPGLPIAVANEAACALTGYGRGGLVGNGCRMLQGKKTTAAAVRAMTKAISERRTTVLHVLNFRKVVAIAMACL